MNEPAIQIKNLSKRYSITHKKGGYIALRDILSYAWRHPIKIITRRIRKIFGRETKEDFWALKDINFTVKKGEVIGIIGKNGAGKSTLLKILTQITPPTEGEVKMRGKVSSLLEVGTGFHPELTGRENIFLNGAILGMTRKEILEKFDKIVEFSGVEKFIDTPVKRYSSGMYVRLAFSVAAHLEPDILLIDEVLAVGDIEFQKKCLGKINEVTKTDGRTVIFVSHNMRAIEDVAERCILLERGQIIKIGTPKEVVGYYTGERQGMNAVLDFTPKRGVIAAITKISIHKKDGKPSAAIPISEDVKIKIEFTVIEKIDRATISLVVLSEGETILNSYETDQTKKLQDYEPGAYITEITLPAFLLNVGFYHFDISLQKPGIEFVDRKQFIPIEVTDEDNPKTILYKSNVTGVMGSILPYETKKIS